MFNSIVITGVLILISNVCTELCPIVKTVDNFKADKYMGKWYEIQRYPQIFEMSAKNSFKCVIANYTLNPNGTVSVINEGIIKPNIPLKIVGIATVNPNNHANMTVTFNGASYKGKYWVLDTDYTSYSLVYSCSLDANGNRTESAWILSRNRTLQTQTVQKITQELVKAKSSTELFIKTDQTDCKN